MQPPPGSASTLSVQRSAGTDPSTAQRTVQVQRNTAQHSPHHSPKRSTAQRSTPWSCSDLRSCGSSSGRLAPPPPQNARWRLQHNVAVGRRADEVLAPNATSLVLVPNVTRLIASGSSCWHPNPAGKRAHPRSGPRSLADIHSKQLQTQTAHPRSARSARSPHRPCSWSLPPTPAQTWRPPRQCRSPVWCPTPEGARQGITAAAARLWCRGG